MTFDEVSSYDFNPFFLNQIERRICVVGDVMIDKYIIGNVSRISPEAPVPILLEKDNFSRLGGAANVANNIAQLRQRVDLYGLVGDDDDGDTISDKISNSLIDDFLCVVPRIRTSSKTRFLSFGQQLIRLDNEDIVPEEYRSVCMQRLKENIHSYDLIVLSDYNKGVLYECQEIIDLAVECKIPVVVDPKGNDFSRYANASVITPNLSEFEGVVGKCNTDQDILEKAIYLKRTFGFGNVVVTLSEKGMIIIDESDDLTRIPTVALDVVDVTGAGDSVIAVIATMLANKVKLIPAAHIANFAAGIAVSKHGTYSVSYEELSTYQIPRKGLPCGVVIYPQLPDILSSINSDKELGKKIVMTNGCFDILHAGHVSYLSQAKMLGDILVVAINDDESISRIKGMHRPINCLNDRLTVLKELVSVDYVIPFSDDTPLSIIKKVVPHILVKGGDYEPISIVGYDFVKLCGGEVRTLPYIEGQSSSNIISKILDTGPSD